MREVVRLVVRLSLCSFFSFLNSFLCLLKRRCPEAGSPLALPGRVSLSFLSLPHPPLQAVWKFVVFLFWGGQVAFPPPLPCSCLVPVSQNPSYLLLFSFLKVELFS